MLPVVLQMMLYGLHMHVMVVVQRALSIGAVQHDDVVAYSSPTAAAAISAPNGETTTAPRSTILGTHNDDAVDDVYQCTDASSLRSFAKKINYLFVRIAIVGLGLAAGRNDVFF